MKRQEGTTEASREGRHRFRDTEFGTGNLGGVTGQEVVFGLLVSKDRHGRQYTISVIRQEDHFLGIRATGDGFDDVFDVVHRIRDTRVLRSRRITKLALALFVHDHVFKQCVTTNGVINVGFMHRIQIDHLCIATAFVIEDTFIVPTVFVVTDQEALRVSRQRRLTRTGQTEEDRRVGLILVRVSRAVHRSDTAQRVQVVHDGEHAFLHFATVPGVQNDLHLFLQIKDNSRRAIQTEFFVVFDAFLTGGNHQEVGFAEVFKFFSRRTDEHVRHKVSLPSDFHHKAHFQARVFVRTAEGIHDEKSFVGE